MRIDKVLLVFRKDWAELRRNWQVVLPIVLLPLMISMSLPMILNSLSNSITMPGSALGTFEIIIRNLPYQTRREVEGMTYPQATIYMISIYLIAPVFLTIPILTSSVIASDSFAGEKERRTIEALLATPMSDAELFMGKVLVAFVPSVTITAGSSIVYSIATDLILSGLFNGRLLFPNPIWILVTFGLAPAIAIASIGLTVMISLRVKGFREAQQLSAFLMIPIMLLTFVQVSGVMILGSVIMLGSIVLFLMIDAILLYHGVEAFKRDEILSKLA